MVTQTLIPFLPEGIAELVKSSQEGKFFGGQFVGNLIVSK